MAFVKKVVNMSIIYFPFSFYSTIFGIFNISNSSKYHKCNRSDLDDNHSKYSNPWQWWSITVIYGNSDLLQLPEKIELYRD